MLIHASLKALKARHRGKDRTKRKTRRTSVHVCKKGVLLVQDELQQGPMHADVVKDRATMRVEAVSVGRPTCAQDTIRMLETLRMYGRLPLVFGTDNGGAYIARPVKDYLDFHMVIHLKNLKHTPQHNGGAERAVRESKDIVDLSQADNSIAGCRQLAMRWAFRNANLPRQSRNWKTADQMDSSIEPWYLSIRRRDFFQAAQASIKLAVQPGMKQREACKAEREAIFQTLEGFGLILRTTGGAHSRPKKPEVVL